MSRLKLICVTSASLLGGTSLGLWWEREGRVKLFSGYDDGVSKFLPVTSVHASTLPPPVFYPPNLPAPVPSPSIPSPVTIPSPAAVPSPLPIPSPVFPAKTQTPPAKKSSQMMKFGFPTLDQLKWRSDYVLSYDRRNRSAFWVFEHLTPDSCTKNEKVERKNCDFKTDPSVHHFFQSSHVDYKHSGFDRGHLAAAGNHRSSQEDCQETFYYSNMAPQVGKGFNRDAWNNLEKMVRSFARKNLNVYVVTGPLYLPHKEADGKLWVKYQVIGPNQVSVPTHFFKVAVVQTPSGGYELHSFVLPNAVIENSQPLTSFYVPLESVERSAGFFLFDKIPRESFQKVNGVERRSSRLAAIGA